MPSTLTRRPVPALVALLALLLLTGLVWWRVLNRNSGGDTPKNCPSSTASSRPALTTLPAPSSISVQVLNSTDRSGIAAQARMALVSAGFNSPAQAGNDTAQHHNKIPGVAEIRYGVSEANAAKTLSYYFPTARLVPTSSKTSTVVVSLGAKYRAVPTPAQVSAAMAKAGVQAGASTPSPGTASRSSSSSPSC